MLASFGVSAEHFFRAEFDGSATPAMGTAPIEDVTLVSNGFLVFVSNGVVWSSDEKGVEWLKRTPPASIASVTAVDDSTWYAAATTGAIYKTIDGGQHWTEVFSAPIKPDSHWHVQLQANGNHVAAYFYGADAAMSQQAYVFFESNDSGKTWNKLFDEGYFPDYGETKSLYQQTLSLQPGPFALLANGDVALAGVNPVESNITTLSVITPAGKRVLNDPIGPTANSPDVFGQRGMSTAISAPDVSHLFVVGGNIGKAVMEVSTDGGATWVAR